MGIMEGSTLIISKMTLLSLLRPQMSSGRFQIFWKEADYRGCKLASPAWVFNKVRLVSSNSIEEPRASLLVDAEGAIVRVAVTFDMSGFSTTRGQGESFIDKVC
jgi:hypothetical protein